MRHEDPPPLPAASPALRTITSYVESPRSNGHRVHTSRADPSHAEHSFDDLVGLCSDERIGDEAIARSVRVS